MTIAVYPGSFDPITNGHLDIIKRVSALFDKLVIGVYENPDKPLLFSPKERVKLAEEAVTGLPNVCVEPYSGLTIEFVRKVGSKLMIHGLRANSDFEHEFEMALMNKNLAPDIELVCLMASCQYQFLSSKLLKEVAALGGCLDGMVPDHVAAALKEKLSTKPSTVPMRKVEAKIKRVKN